VDDRHDTPREGSGDDRQAGGAAAGKSDFARLGELVSAALPESERSDPGAARRVAEAWTAVLGPEAARNSQPRHLRNRRLVVATSSSAWAQALQDQAEEVVSRLNKHLGTEVVDSAIFRPAGWDPCAGRGSPSPLEAGPGQWADDPTDRHDADPAGERGAASRTASGPPRRRLTDEELAAVEDVRRTAADPELGALIAAAMRASLEHKADDDG
jgi:hypothetical protein